MTQDAFYQDALDAIRQGVDLNRRGKDGISLLHYWVGAGREDIVELLISNGADVNQGDDFGWTPLHFAAANGNAPLVRLLVERGANVNALAVGGESPSVIDRLLGRKSRVSPRRAALNAGHAEIADYLAKAGGNS
jgi:ankyrin repeat protein